MHWLCRCHGLVAVGLALRLLLLAVAVHAAHFELGHSYRYRVQSAALSHADVEKTILSAGGSPSNADTQGTTSFTFNADIEISPYEVTANKTFCKVSFLGTPEVVLGRSVTDDLHDGSGALDFHGRWFGFALTSDGVVDHVIFDRDDHASVLQIKRGLASLFSAPVNHPATGPKRRSFVGTEPTQFGTDTSSYDVHEDGHLIIYTKRPSLVRRGAPDETQLDHIGEKTLVKDGNLGHFVSISVRDVVSLQGSASVEQKNLNRRDSDDDSAWDMLMKTSGTSETTFITSGPSFHVDGPPDGLEVGPLFAPPPVQYKPLRVVMGTVRTSLKCFDHSFVASEVPLSGGEQASCFSSARKALESLSPADSVTAAQYLMSTQNLQGAVWVGFDLVGEMCPTVPVLLDHMLQKAFEVSGSSDESLEYAALALKASFKCTQPTEEGLSILKSVLVNHTLPNSAEGHIIEPSLLDHAALLLGHLGHQLRQAGDVPAAASVTAILITSLDQPSAKLSRRSLDIPDFGEAPEDEHFHAQSVDDSATAARRATLIHALGNTRDGCTVQTLRTAIFDRDTDVAYHPVIQQAALQALGHLDGREVEDVLLATLTSAEHVPVHGAALVALKARDRDVDIVDLAKGAEELARMYHEDVRLAGPLSARALRARGLVEIKIDNTSPGLDRSIDIKLAAPAFIWDQKFGPDLVGVRAQAHAVNEVHLFLSILQSFFNLEINNVASAQLYFDIGSYQELDIFRAELQLIGSVSYNMHMGNFKMSDVTHLQDVFSGWVDKIVAEYEEVKATLELYWQVAKNAVDSLIKAVELVRDTDWVKFFDRIGDAVEDDVAFIIDMFFDLEDNLKAFGLTVWTTITGTVQKTVDQVETAINDLAGAMIHLLECPERSVAAVLGAVENIRDTAVMLHANFDDLVAMFSVENLEALVPSLGGEDFEEYVSNTLAAFPEFEVLSEVITEFGHVKEEVDTAVSLSISAYTDFRIKLQDLVVFYNKLKGLFDATFGPKAHADFPKVAATAFPSETLKDKDGTLYQGMRLTTTVGQTIVAPFAGTAEKWDPTTMRISVTESSLKKHYLYIGNITLNATAIGATLKKGDPIGFATKSSIAFVIYGGLFSKSSVDPLKYLSRALPFKNPLIVTANQYGLTVLTKAIIPIQPIIKRSTKNATSDNVAGDGLTRRTFDPTNVCNDPRFQNPTQVCIDAAVPESPRNMLLYNFKQQLLIAGIIPVFFSLQFDATMGISAEVSMCLFDLTVSPTLTPHFAIIMTGRVAAGVPGASIGLTAIGTVADTHVPVKAQFPLAKIPVGVCLDIDVVIVPLAIELAFDIELLMIKYSQTIVKFALASITIPVINTCPADGIAASDAKGYLVDSTGPIVTDSAALQVPDESLTAPFVFARFASHDPESGIESVSIGVGWSPADNSVVPVRVMPRGQGDSWTIPMPSNQIYDEKKLFVNVYHKNQQNLTTTTSTSLLFDLSPPVIFLWNQQTDISAYDFTVGTQNPRAVLRKNQGHFTEKLGEAVNGTSYTGIPDNICFYYSISDATRQNATMIAIGSSTAGNEASDFMAWTMDARAGNGVTAVCRSMPLIHGQQYFLNVKSTNALGFTTVAGSKPTIADLTPPVPGNMFFGTVLGVTMNGTILNTTATFSFIGFQDPESDIAYWKFAIGPSNVGERLIEKDITQWAQFGDWTPYYVNDGYQSYIPYAISGLNMTEGNHTVCISSVNFVGLSTVTCQKGYIVDQTPPTGRAILKPGSNFDLAVNFEYDDDRSSVQTVMVGLGDKFQPHFADYVTLDVGQNPQNTFTFPVDLSMQGQIVYGLLIVVDYASNSVHLPSDNAILVDILPPVTGQVSDGDALGKDLAWIGSADRLCASWTEWSSNVTGVGGYNLCFGTAQGWCDVVAWQPVQKQRAVCAVVSGHSGFNIVTGQTFYAGVLGFNGINTTNSTAWSNGVTLDLTPPTNFTVAIKTATGARYVRDIAETYVSWTDSSDYESGLVSYEVALIRRRGSQDTTLVDYAVPDRSQPLMTQTLVRGPSAQTVDGDNIFACVRVSNAALLTTLNCSTPVSIDSGRPVLLSRTYLGSSAALSPFYVKDTRSIDFLWAWDAVSKIRDYGCQLYELSGTQALNVPILADATGCHISAPSQLIDGTTYQAVGTVQSFAGTEAQTIFSFVPTNKPPSYVRGGVGSALYGHADVSFTLDLTAAKAWCEFSSAIPITSYGFAFGTAPNTTDVSNGWIQTTTAAFSLPYNFTDGTTYYAKCNATNDAGQPSAIYSFPVGTKVVESAKPGRVFDGPKAGVETLYQTSTETVVATFEGFQSAEGHPGILYTWGLGTTPTTADVVNFTSAGLLQPTTTSNGTIFWTGTKLRENVLYFVHVQAMMAGDGSLQFLNATSTGFRVFAQAPITGYEQPTTQISYLSSADNATFNMNCTAVALNAGLDRIQLRARKWVESGSNDLTLSVLLFASTTKKTAISALALQRQNDGISISTSCNATAGSVGISSLPRESIIIHDSDAPIGAANLSCWPNWVAQGANTAFCDWEDARDEQSGIASYTLNVGTTAGGGEIYSYPETIGKNFTLEVPDFIPDGTPVLFVSVIAVNAVGLETIATTSVSVDWDPPAAGAGTVQILTLSGAASFGGTNGSTTLDVDNYRPATCQTERKLLRAGWNNAFQELSSGIVSYDITVSSSTPATVGELNHVIVPWISVGNVTSYTLTLNEPLPIDTMVFVSVRAWSGAGLSTVRSSPKIGIVAGYNTPASGPRRILVQEQLATASNTTNFAIKSNFWRASWIFSHICPISQYKWSVVDITDVPNTIIYGPVLTNVSSGVALNLDLAPNRTYATRVTAYDSIGISSFAATSTGTTIIWTPAAPGKVFDGPVAGVQTSFFVTLTALTASWESFSTESCQVHGYQWAVGIGTDSLTEQTSVMPFTDAGSDLFGYFALDTNLTLYTDYYTTVRAVSCTGEILTGHSTGFHVGARDGPNAGQVRIIGTRTTMSGVASIANATYISIAWSGFTSVWSDLKFEVALGTSADPNGPLVRNFTSVKVDNNADEVIYAFDDVQLNVSSATAIVQYYAYVRATDSSFQVAVQASDPFNVDQSPPNAGRIVLQFEAQNDTTWQSSTQNITFSITWVSDPESSISDIAYRVVPFNVPGPVFDWITLGNRSTMITGNLASGSTTGDITAFVDLLSNATLYQVQVKVTNGAGLSAEQSSSLFAVDVDTPSAGSLVVGTDFSTNLHYSTSSDKLDFLYGEAFGQSEISCFSQTRKFAGNISLAGLTSGQHPWILPTTDCAVPGMDGLDLVLSSGNSSCEIQSTAYAAGSMFSALLQASAAANSFTSFVISDSPFSIDEQAVGSGANVSNITSPFNAVGFQISGGTPPAVNIWRLDRNDKARRSETIALANSTSLMGILNYSITLRASDILLEIFDNGTSLGRKTMGGMNTQYFWVDQIPRMSARIRLWAPSGLVAVPSAKIVNVTHPVPNDRPCSFQPIWGSLLSGLSKVEIGLGSARGLLDVMSYQAIAPTNWTRPGCLGDDCFMSSLVNSSWSGRHGGVQLHNISLAGLNLKPYDKTNDWCSLSPLEGGCSYAASCINDAYDPSTGNNTFRCICGDGWRGNGFGLHGCQSVPQCQEAAVTALALCAPGAQCFDHPGTYICACPKGFAPATNSTPYDIDSAGCIEQDECAIAAAAHVSLCGPGGVCLNTVGDYQCKCRAGFQSVDDHTCVDIDECARISCPKGTKCVNQVGAYQCVLSCPSGTSLSANSTCVPATFSCSSAVPLALGSTVTSALAAPQVLMDPRFGNRGRLGLWYIVDNPARSTVKISLGNNGLYNSMILHLWDDCLSAPTELVCSPQNTCSLTKNTAQIYILASATVPNSFSLSAFGPASPYCTLPCANGGVCVGDNLCSCAANSQWTGPTCETPQFDMIAPRSISNFTCHDAVLGGAVNSRGRCAPGPAPGEVAPSEIAHDFIGCYQLSSIAPFEPARLSFVFPNSRLSFNVSRGACAATCKAANLPLFAYTTLATWRTPLWPALYNATSQCLCMPSLPTGAIQQSASTCNAQGIGAAFINVLSSPIFYVKPFAPWCPIPEISMSPSTDLAQRNSLPQACAPRFTETGKTCLFPFWIRGRIFTDCTSEGDTRPWCYTDSTYSSHEYCLGSALDFCSHPSSICGGNSTCVNLAGGPSCRCADGYVKNQSGQCVDQDECAASVSPCSVFAQCINTVGSYICACNHTSGYFETADNYTCSYDPDNAGWLAGLSSYFKMPTQSKSPRSYVASLRVTNKANLSSTTWTKPIMIDQDPPTFQKLTFYYQGIAITVLRNTSLEAEWKFQSNISGMAYYSYSLGSAPGAADIVAKTRTLASNVTFQVTNPNFSQVFFSVTGVSGAFLNTTQVVPMFLSTGPPSAENASVSYAQVGQFLTWKDFTDPVGLANYYVGIGTQIRGNDLLNWTMSANANVNTGPFLTGLCSGLGCGTPFLPSSIPSVATPVWMSIRAENRAGFWSRPISATFPTVLLGSDAAILKGNVTSKSTWGFDDSSAIATIAGRLPTNATNTVAMLPLGPYQYDISKNTSITLARPDRLMTLRAGSMYAQFADVSVHIVSLMYDGSLSKTLPSPGVNASITVKFPRTDGPPALYYQGQMNTTAFVPTPWISQATDFDSTNKVVSWKPIAPGIHALYYNRTFPSFIDLNSDALADILHVIHSTVTEKVDFGWGIFGGSIAGPVPRRNYVASLSPAYSNKTVGFGPIITNNDYIAAVGDFDADGRMDYVLSSAGYPIYSDWGSASYKIVFNKTSTASMTVNPPKIGVYPQYYDRHILMGFADVDGDTFLDSVWYSTGFFSINYSPGVTICSGKGGNYATGCASPWYTSFAPYSIIGMGSWSAGSYGILTYTRDFDGTLSFSIVNLLLAKSSADAITSISTLAPVAVSMTVQALRWQVWLARVPGDLNGDGSSDLILQCTSWVGACGPSNNLYSYTVIWYLNSLGKVIGTSVLTTPTASRIALGTLIYR
ncbi:hypothetical protein BDZ88DRAFT_491682 [Geranomyces variabilis]|nr:hypothetical protein BDZ88DRAFT_491682 [Geranomyces variabilis]KAJ3131627.1 hypothetical protein HDU90_008149 [Geranomyces variabilis]